jgi:hypothetical protein
VQGRDGGWYDANSPATAALVDMNRAKTYYRPTVVNCGSDALKNVVVTTIITGSIQIIIGNLEIGGSRIMAVIEAAPQQVSATATAFGIGVLSGDIVQSIDPAQVKYNPPPTPLPETGGRFTPQVILAAMLLFSGVGMTRYHRRRNRRGLELARSQP